MINTKYLATYFTDLLNQYGATYNKSFKIFADEGELKREVKEYGKQPKQFTTGLVEIISSTLTPIRGIRLNTYAVQLSLYIDLAMDGVNENKESYNLMTIRDIITKIIEDKNGTTAMVDVDGTSYSQSTTIGYPTTGIKSEVGFISDCLPLYWTFNFAFFEDGINANNCTLYINDVNIPFTRLVCTRQRTAEQNNFASDSSSKTIMQINGLSLDIVMPALSNNDVSNLIMKDVLNGGNYAISVVMETPVFTKAFIGTLGNTQASLDVATNIGYNISIVEGVPNTLDYSYDTKWSTKTSNSSSATVEITDGKPRTIYWGDGYVDVFKTETITHIYDDGKTKHTIRIYGG